MNRNLVYLAKRFFKYHALKFFQKNGVICFQHDFIYIDGITLGGYSKFAR